MQETQEGPNVTPLLCSNVLNRHSYHNHNSNKDVQNIAINLIALFSFIMCQAKPVAADFTACKGSLWFLDKRYIMPNEINMF